MIQDRFVPSHQRFQLCSQFLLRDQGTHELFHHLAAFEEQ
jgi:hypothetical protein